MNTRYSSNYCDYFSLPNHIWEPSYYRDIAGKSYEDFILFKNIVIKSKNRLPAIRYSSIRFGDVLLHPVHRMHRKFSITAPILSEELNVHRDTAENNANIPFEFTEANMVRIAAIIQNYPEGAQRSALGACLDIVQRQMGWVPIPAMHKVAELLSIPRVRVYEWATFYTMVKRRFRGKFHVKVCVTTPCMVRGSDIILKAVEQATRCCEGSVSADGMFGVDTVQCQGACANAPMFAVDDDYFEDVNVCDVYNIIQTLRCGGIPPPGPQNGRFACEPICGLTSLCECPPPPGFGIQRALLEGK